AYGSLEGEIAERRKIEESLRQSEERYRLLADNVADTIWLIDPTTTHFAYVSPAVEALSGYTAEELIGRSVMSILTLESQERVATVLANELPKSTEDPLRITKVELELRRKEGSTVWVEVIARVLYVDWLASHAILGVTRDISERKAAEAERRQLQDQLVQAQKMEAVGTLAGGVAHDFRNSLQAILGNVQVILLNKGQQDPDFDNLVAIESAVQRANDLTKQLLTFSRKVESRHRAVDLNRAVRQVGDLLRRTIPRMIDIDLRLADPLDAVSADPAQIEQVLMNLAINARDAMPDGGRLGIQTQNVVLDEADCRSHIEASPGAWVLLSVSDDGQGIDGDVLEHIFEPFYTTKEAGKGTGLGLAMVFGIVKSHGGHIRCETEPGEGSTFHVYLPALGDAETDLEPVTEESALIGGTETILLVDDEDLVRRVAERMLHRFGYQVLSVPDGETALEIYRDEAGQISLVILDLVMPGMGGRACLERLLDIDASARVIIASGYAPDADAGPIIAAKARGHIQKPYDLKDLLGIIRRVLDQVG
ncbi:MAG: PAS domain S-box protein, partial [Deltaproteobacteria bacterium]|nr:PAS domain S-box protein [Deltaproteobacteria bacterium]